jgi:hypothetical protein
MQSPLQEILSPPAVPGDAVAMDDEPGHSEEVTPRFWSRMIGVSTIAALFPAAAATGLLAGHDGGAVRDFLSMAGCGLMVWAMATFIFVLAATMLMSRYAELGRHRPIALRRQRSNRYPIGRLIM